VGPGQVAGVEGLLHDGEALQAVGQAGEFVGLGAADLEVVAGQGGEVALAEVHGVEAVVAEHAQAHAEATFHGGPGVAQGTEGGLEFLTELGPGRSIPVDHPVRDQEGRLRARLLTKEGESLLGLDTLRQRESRFWRLERRHDLFQTPSTWFL